MYVSIGGPALGRQAIKHTGKNGTKSRKGMKKNECFNLIGR